MGSIERISTPEAAPPAGHYVQATKWGGLVFVSGQLGGKPDGSHTFDRPFEEQARQALNNTLNILSTSGCDKQDVLRLTAYIVGPENWSAFNAVFLELFGQIKPARSVVPVPGLHLGYAIEIEAVGGVGAGSLDDTIASNIEFGAAFRS